MKDVNHLYLQSLLDPKRFEFASESWLYEIRQKLHDYKATEGLLPSFSEQDIVKESAGEVKYSPLPVWLEELLDLYAISENGKINKLLTGITEYEINGQKINACFDSSSIGFNPECEHLTLQHPYIKRLLDGIDGNSQKKIPVITSHDGNDINGFLTVWKISAKNNYETKTTYSAQFVADNGKVYAPYGNDVWNRLVQTKDAFEYCGEMPYNLDFDNNSILQNNLHAVFHRMECEIENNLKSIFEKKVRAIDYSEQRISKIGISNIRNSKLKRLKEERKDWQAAFEKSKSIIPDVTIILTVRVNG